MFFLGGINSVLPYIIYLSLVWVFLIVGFSGKMMQARQWLSPRAYHSSSNELRHHDQKVIQFYAQSLAIPRGNQHNDPADSVWNFFVVPAVNAGLFAPQSCPAVSLHHLSTFGLRGPPASLFIS